MRAIPWYRRCSWIFLSAHSALALTVLNYVASLSLHDETAVLCWTLILVLDTPSSWVSLFVTDTLAIAPLFVFGLFGGVQWFVFGVLIDRLRIRWEQSAVRFDPGEKPPGIVSSRHAERSVPSQGPERKVEPVDE